MKTIRKFDLEIEHVERWRNAEYIPIQGLGSEWNLMPFPAMIKEEEQP